MNYEQLTNEDINRLREGVRNALIIVAPFWIAVILIILAVK